MIKGRQAMRWVSLFSEHSFARTAFLGFLQHQLAEDWDSGYIRFELRTQLDAQLGINELTELWHPNAFIAYPSPVFSNVPTLPPTLEQAYLATTDFLKAKGTPVEFGRKVCTNNKLYAFNPLDEPELEELAVPIRSEAVFPGRLPFRQAHRTVRPPKYDFTLISNRYYRVNARFVALPPGAGRIYNGNIEDIQEKLPKGIRTFWKSLRKIYFADQEAAHTWRGLLYGKWKFKGEFGQEWAESCTEDAYRGEACTLCREAPESLKHIVYQCSVVQSLWNHCSLSQQPFVSSPHGVYSSFRSCRTKTSQQAWHRDRARFYHGIYRIYVYARRYSGNPVDPLDSTVCAFVQSWVDGERFRHYSEFRPQSHTEGLLE